MLDKYFGFLRVYDEFSVLESLIDHTRIDEEELLMLLKMFELFINGNISDLEDYYTKEEFNEGRKKMAKMPASSELILNPLTVCPGFRIENVFVFPGVPEIMKKMFVNVLKNIKKGESKKIITINTNLYESLIAEKLSIIQEKNPKCSIGSYPYFDKVAKEMFPDLKYYVMPEGETWRFEHLIVPSMSNHDDGITTPHLPLWLNHFKGLFGFKGLEPHRKIIVLRPGAKTRKLVNSAELILALKGWETVTLENMTIKEQFKTFAEATHILAAHGAGLVNLLWCKPDTKVIEIQDPNMLHKKVYPLLSHHLGLKHELYLAKTISIGKQNKKPKGVKRINDLINFEVNIPDLIRLLD